jgi:hypothetical protein
MFCFDGSTPIFFSWKGEVLSFYGEPTKGVSRTIELVVDPKDSMPSSGMVV